MRGEKYRKSNARIESDSYLEVIVGGRGLLGEVLLYGKVFKTHLSVIDSPAAKEVRVLFYFQIMFMYSLDRVLEKSTLSVDILSVDRGKLDALVFPSNAGAEEGFNCRLSCMKCCGRYRFYLYCRGRAVTNVCRTCGPTPLHIQMAIKYV